jgi:galactose mutarotase-like enzyme
VPPHPGTLTDDEFGRRFFGGLVTTCGLEAFGPAGEDRWGTWGQHGHINHLPAQEIEMHCDVDDAETFVTLRGVVRQAALFKESLRLQRCWTMSRDGTRLRLHDRVTNDGGHAVPHMLLYHCNVGYPMLDESTRISISQRSMRPRDDAAKAGVDVWNRGGPPQAGFAEQVFIHDPQAAADGWAIARIENENLALALEIRFRPDQLRACFSWRMLGVRSYVMAIEPANCETIEGRIAARERGTLAFLKPDETREYELEFRFTGLRGSAG